MRRVVITGMGAVSPVGADVPSYWQALVEGRSGLGPITHFDATPFRNPNGGEVREWGKVVEPGLEHASRANQYAFVAAKQALADAQLLDGPVPADRLGLCLATNFGGLEYGEAFLAALLDEERPEPQWFEQYAFWSAADLICGRFAVRGPRTTLSLSCASGTAAIGYALDMIRLGRAEAMLAGGFDELSRFAYSGLSALRTVTPDLIRPFDKRRNGTMFAEGAGVLVLETLESAQARGATIHAEVLGHCMNNDAFHMTAPDKSGRGITEVMQQALRDANVSAQEVDHINAHGTGTQYNDAIETTAIKAVLGDQAYEVPVVSIKSMMGHTMGAAGALEAVASVMTIMESVVPPTKNLEEPDPVCDLDYVPGEARKMEVRTVLCNSYGIGGANASVVLRRYE